MSRRINTSHVAHGINFQYFTPVSTAEWCLNELGAVWGLEGEALEPAVGSGSFVRASRYMGLGLNWTTIDKFPNPSFMPDRDGDFLESEPRFRPDYLITNPPFGHTNVLAKAFLCHAFKWSNRVAMILPKGARRVAFQDNVPIRAHKILDINPPDPNYQDSQGRTYVHNNCFQAWEYRVNPRTRIVDTLDLRPTIQLTLASAKFARASDLQIVRWGTVVGGVVDREKDLKSTGSRLWVTYPRWISKKKVADILRSLDYDDFKESSTCAPSIDNLILIHRFNVEATHRGLIPPPSREPKPGQS